MAKAEVASVVGEDSSTRQPAPTDRKRTEPGLVLALVLAAGFLLRFGLADANSYWVDELISVKRYVLDFAGRPSAMIWALAEESIHPPLYQLVLYWWIDLFGDSEVATRTLSNIFVTVGSGFTYLMVRRLQPAWVAVGAAAFVNFGYYGMRFGLETRSYALTLALASVAGWSMIVILQRLGSRPRPLAGHFGATSVWVAANTGLLFTHYYNAFFVAAQALLVTSYGLWLLLRRRSRWQTTAGLVVAVGVPVSVYAALWGPVILASFERNEGRWSRSIPPRNIEGMLTGFSALNLPGGRWAALGILIAASFAVVYSAATSHRTRAPFRLAQHGWEILIPALLMVGSMTIAYGTFIVASFARWNGRYYIFLVPALAALLVLGLRFLMQVIGQLVGVESRITLTARSHAMGCTLLAVTLLVIWPGIQGATTNKTDFRGVAQRVVQIVEKTPDRTFAIYTTEARPHHQFIEYYLARFSDTIRPDGQISRYGEELDDARFAFEDDEDFIRDHDYLLVVFGHERTTNLPRAMELLNETYELEVRQLNNGNRAGYKLYSTR